MMDARREMFKKEMAKRYSSFIQLQKALDLYDQIDLAVSGDLPSMVALAGVRYHAKQGSLELDVYQVMRRLK